MKRITIIILALTIAMSALFTTGCGTNVDENFKTTLMNSLHERWSVNTYGMDGFAAAANPELIDKEYEALLPYREMTFENEELGKLADEYISSLEHIKDELRGKSALELLTDSIGALNEERGLIVAINEIQPLEFEDYDDQGTLKDMINSEKVSDFLGSIKASDFKLTKQSGSEWDFEYTNTYTAKVKNTSGVDIDYAQLDIKVYDKNGEDVTSDFVSFGIAHGSIDASKKEWKAGQVATLEFDLSSIYKINFDHFEIDMWEWRL